MADERPKFTAEMHGSTNAPAPSTMGSMSNQVTTTILGRRSTREWLPNRSIPRRALAEIVHCGLAAPSSKNAQPWRLHVVSDPHLLRELANEVQTSKEAGTYVPMDPHTGKPRPDWPSTVAESSHVLGHASTGIFIENLGTFSDGRQTIIDAIRSGRVGTLIGYTFEVLGVGAAIQNMWIAAEGLGIKGCFMGDVVIAEKYIANRLGMENDLIGVLALGYSTSAARPSTTSKDPTDSSHVVWHEVPNDARGDRELP